MNPVQNQALVKYLDEEGYKCSVCLDVYDLNVQAKKPTLLSCTQHNVCIECIETVKRDRKCPECRQPLTFSAAPVAPDSRMITMIGRVINDWNKKNSASPAAASPAGHISAPSKVQKVEQSLIPERFECVSLCDHLWDYRSIEAEIAAAMPKIVEAMSWDNVQAKELQEEYQNTSRLWVLFTDRNTKEPKGIAQLKPISNTQWEAHWGGVNEKKPELYFELYKFLIAEIEKSKQNNAMDWRNVSLTSYFNFTSDAEEQWLRHLQRIVVDNNLLYERQHIHRHWGTQVKLTVYPCRKEGHYQKSLELDNKYVLERDIPFETMMAPKVTHCLEQSGLNQIIRICSLEAPANWNHSIPHNPEYAASQIRAAFTKEPQNFFVYTIDGQAKGFVQFKRENGALVVQNCKLVQAAHKFADHFILQFIEWSKTKHTYAKGISAKEVVFPFAFIPTISGPVRTAIDNSIGELKANVR